MSEEGNPNIEKPIEKSEEEDKSTESSPSEELSQVEVSNENEVIEESPQNDVVGENEVIEESPQDDIEDKNELIEENIEPEKESSEVIEGQGELTADDIDNIDALIDEISEVNSPEDENNVSDIETSNDGDVKVISVKELTERSFQRNTIEAALLAAQRPIGIEEISIKLEMKKAEIEKLIQELAEDYMDRSTAIEIVQIGEGYSMQIKPEYTEKITKFASGGLIPKAVMRTLTIIAVKQPILKSLLVKMRGSTAYEHCKFLIDRGFVTAYKKGRSSILETTDQFADTFGLSRNVEMLKRQLIEQLDIRNSEEPLEGEESAEITQEEQKPDELKIQSEQPTEPDESELSSEMELETEQSEADPPENEEVLEPEE